MKFIRQEKVGEKAVERSVAGRWCAAPQLGGPGGKAVETQGKAVTTPRKGSGNTIQGSGAPQHAGRAEHLRHDRAQLRG